MNSFRFIFILLLTLSGCKDKNLEPRFEPTDVLVGIKTGYTIDKVFDLINQVNLEVDYIEYSYYRSSLPSDSLQYVLDYLNTRPYAHRPDWPVTGYLHYQTNVIHVFPKLFQANDENNQRDWLECIKVMKLKEITDSEVGKMIYFHVPQGIEKKWVEKFQQMDLVEWAQLNYYHEISL
ncbi:hypothetical protein [Dyadobacter pollutisoli]|jgi:hypothetical protein|uniref:Lipoprotein n=1 Tax=Dyadobacter pollutisoli TaxID=2910158 RepID=A0A9E8SKH8_9BACT|nr:hypothetical protein [Dyadobacter pollutisoli]WAC12495.1 hypothetical protein ON006_00745 [Dyadobacter pollutisoli]